MIIQRHGAQHSTEQPVKPSPIMISEESFERGSPRAKLSTSRADELRNDQLIFVLEFKESKCVI